MDTVTATCDAAFSVDAQAAWLRRYAHGTRDVDNLTAGAIVAFVREGGVFDADSAEKRIEYIRNALAAAELVRAELEAAGR